LNTKKTIFIGFNSLFRLEVKVGKKRFLERVRIVLMLIMMMILFKKVNKLRG